MRGVVQRVESPFDTDIADAELLNDPAELEK